MKLLLSIALVISMVVLAPYTQADPTSLELEQSRLTFDGRLNQPFFGDLAQMRERRIIRVLVSYNRTNFFISDQGHAGIEYELLKAYEAFLNRGPLRERYQTHLVFLVTPFGELLDSLNQGYGDIAAAGLTITPERKNITAFTQPYISNVNEILISHQRAPKVERLEDLSGKRVVLVANSSYVVHLQRANQALGQAGLAPIEIIQADPRLDAEDILEMINAEIYDFTLVDQHIAKVWQNVLSNIHLHQDLVFHHKGEIGWAVRADNPHLLNSLNQFIEQTAKPGRLLSNLLYQKYFQNSHWVERPLTPELLVQIDYLKPYFQLYADFYDIDWILAAALAYQESHFHHSRVSPRGAVGIMQLRPSTARSIGFNDIEDLEKNIHAGIYYLAHLQERFFNSRDYTDEDRINFTLAAYNAGPTRIRQLQRQAERQGLDPYRWFYNVEQLARNHIGQETVNYVIGIQKHKVALRAAQQAELERQLSRPALTAP